MTGGSGNDVYVYSAIANLFTSNAIVDTLVEATSGGTDSIRLDSTGTGFTIAASMDFGTSARNIEQITVVPSGNAYSITLKADADTDAPELLKIDLSGDTTAGGTNTVDLSNVSEAYTVIGSASADTITASLGVDLIDVSATSTDAVLIGAVGSTGVASAGATSTSTATLDIVMAEAGDTISVETIVATNANYDGFASITESGNLSLGVTGSTSNLDANSLRARGIYDADANTFTHATVAGGANAVLVSFAATDAGTIATDSIVIVGVTDVTSMTDGIMTV